MPFRLLALAVILVTAAFPLAAIAQEPDAAPVSSFPIPELGERTGYSILPYFQADALLMHRSNGGFDPGSVNWAAGPRFVLGIPFADNNAIEFVYFGLDGMNGALSIPGAIPASIGASNGSAINTGATYHSFMQNGELNFRHFVTPELSFLVGFRYVNWHETLGTSFDPVNPFAGLALPAGAVGQNYHTSNNLYGLQIGGEWKTALTDRVGLEIGGKAGIFDAQSEMDANLSVPGLGSAATSGTATRTSFVGELSLIGTYKLTDYVKLRAGYQVLWLEGLALAPEQINSANFLGASAVNNRGSVFLHGAVVGLEYRW